MIGTLQQHRRHPTEQVLVDVTVHKCDGIHRCLVPDHGPTEIRSGGYCEEPITQRWVDEIERGRGGSDGFGDRGPVECARPLTDDIRRCPVLVDWVWRVLWVRLKYEIDNRLHER